MNLLNFSALVVQMFYFKIRLGYPVSSVSTSIIDKSTDGLYIVAVNHETETILKSMDFQGLRNFVSGLFLISNGI